MKNILRVFTAVGLLSTSFAMADEKTEVKKTHETDGKKTTDQLDVPLSPGTYIFAFSNRFSPLTDKFVMADIELDYSRSQSY